MTSVQYFSPLLIRRIIPQRILHTLFSLSTRRGDFTWITRCKVWKTCTFKCKTNMLFSFCYYLTIIRVITASSKFWFSVHYYSPIPLIMYWLLRTTSRCKNIVCLWNKQILLTVCKKLVSWCTCDLRQQPRFKTSNAKQVENVMLFDCGRWWPSPTSLSIVTLPGKFTSLVSLKSVLFSPSSTLS